MEDLKALAERVLDFEIDHSTALMCFFCILILSHQSPAKISLVEFMKFLDTVEEKIARFLQDATGEDIDQSAPIRQSELLSTELACGVGEVLVRAQP